MIPFEDLLRLCASGLVSCSASPPCSEFSLLKLPQPGPTSNGCRTTAALAPFSSIGQCLEAAKLNRATAAKLRGRLGFAENHVFGRTGVFPEALTCTQPVSIAYTSS